MGDLEVRLVNFSYEDASSFLSSNLARSVANGDSLVYMGTDGKQELAYVVYTLDRKKARSINLVSFGAAQGYEEDTLLLAQVLKKSRDIVFKAGITRIYAKLYTDDILIPDPKKAMIAANFIPLTLHGIIAIYDMEQALNEPAVQKILNSRQKLPKTKPYTETGLPNVSRYYETKDHEKAILTGVRVSDNMIFYPTFETNGTSKNLRMALPLLLCDSLVEAEKLITDQGTISFQLFNYTHEEVIMNLFGNYIDYYNIQEYIYTKETN